MRVLVSLLEKERELRKREGKVPAITRWKCHADPKNVLKIQGRCTGLHLEKYFREGYFPYKTKHKIHGPILGFLKKAWYLKPDLKGSNTGVMGPAAYFITLEDSSWKHWAYQVLLNSDSGNILIMIGEMDYQGLTKSSAPER